MAKHLQPNERQRQGWLKHLIRQQFGLKKIVPGTLPPELQRQQTSHVSTTNLTVQGPLPPELQRQQTSHVSATNLNVPGPLPPELSRHLNRLKLDWPLIMREEQRSVAHLKLFHKGGHEFKLAVSTLQLPNLK
jgi:hypothetical protein